MHLVYDFDRTLFATRQFKDTWWDHLLNFGYSEQDIDEAAKMEFPRGFSPQQHAINLGLDLEEIEEVTALFHEYTDEYAHSLVFSDVVPFLKEHAGHTQTILTFGNPAFQMYKIQQSGIGPYVNNIIVAQKITSKQTHLETLVDSSDDDIIFIDDNPEELLAVHVSALPVSLFRMLRKGEDYADPHPNDGRFWTAISRLNELKNHL